MSTSKINIGRRLKEAREKLGLSMQEVMRATGVSAHAIGRYERDIGDAPAKLLQFYSLSGIDINLVLAGLPQNEGGEIIDNLADKTVYLILSKGLKQAKNLDEELSILQSSIRWGLSTTVNYLFRNMPE